MCLNLSKLSLYISFRYLWWHFPLYTFSVCILSMFFLVYFLLLCSLPILLINPYFLPVLVVTIFPNHRNKGDTGGFIRRRFRQYGFSAGNIQTIKLFRQKIADEANFAPEEYTVDYKVKNAFNVNKPMAIGAKNAGFNKLAAFIKGRQEEDFTPLTQEQMTGTMARREEGLYDEYGNYKPDKQSNVGSGLFSKYGGSTVGDELDMTEEEIEEFLANGGELEFI